jgi:hypothetical protein
MPLLTINSNISLDRQAAQQLAFRASAHTAQLLGKPEGYIMVQVVTDIIMSFAGNDEPCARLELKSLGLPESSTSAYSEELCSIIEAETGIPPERIYIEFSSPARHMWGWDRRTF